MCCKANATGGTSTGEPAWKEQHVGMALSGLASPSKHSNMRRHIPPLPLPSSVKLTSSTDNTSTHPPPSPTSLPKPTLHVRTYSIIWTGKEEGRRHRKEQAENQNSHRVSKSDTLLLYLVTWWYLMCLLSLRMNMIKLFLHCLITELNWHNDQGERS